MFGGIKSAILASILGVFTLIAFQNCGDASKLTTFGNGDVYEGLDTPPAPDQISGEQGDSTNHMDQDAKVWQPDPACSDADLLRPIEKESRSDGITLKLSVSVDFQTYGIHLTNAEFLANQVSFQIPSEDEAIEIIRLNGVPALALGDPKEFYVAYIVNDVEQSRQYLVCR